MHITFGLSKGLCLLPTPFVWHLIKKLNKLRNDVASPTCKGCISLISFLYDDNIICGFPYCFWSAIAFLHNKKATVSSIIYEMLDQFLWLSSGIFDEPSYLSHESSIFFSNDSWNIDMKYVMSDGFLPNGSIPTCGADCSRTNFGSISSPASSSSLFWFSSVASFLLCEPTF